MQAVCFYFLLQKRCFWHVQSREARLGGALVYSERMTNSIRPLLVHETRGAMVTAKRVQKLSTSMNVELVGGQEVFRQHADGMAPQAQLLPGMLRPQSGSRPGPQGPSHIWLPRVEAWSQTPEVQRET